MGGECVAVVDDPRMIIDLNETKIRSLEQVRAILDGIKALDFLPAGDSRGRCESVESVLNRFRYRELRRPECGLVSS